MILKQTGLPDEYRAAVHSAFYDGRFLKRRGDDCFSLSGTGTRTGKVLMIYALLAEDGDDAIDMLREAENMLLGHQWLEQEHEEHLCRKGAGVAGKQSGSCT